MDWSPLVPEISVSNFEESLKFYKNVLGFEVCFVRSDPRFAYLQLGAVQLMIEEDHGEGWVTGAMDYPRGRGINLQIEVQNIKMLYDRILLEGQPVFRPLKESTYQVNDGFEKQEEFLIQDPDGILLRFVEPK